MSNYYGGQHPLMSNDHARHSRNAEDYAADLAQRHPLDTVTVNDLAALRRIIAEVIDGGCSCGDVYGFHSWHFDGPTDRELFIETALTRLIATAAPATGGYGENFGVVRTDEEAAALDDDDD